MASAGDTVVLDIEVVGIEWERLDESTRGYLLDRARDEEARAEVPHRLALTPGCGRVIAIGLYNVDEGRGAVLLEGEGTGTFEPWEGREDGAYVFRGSETEILEAFWDRMKRYGRVVTYCGRTYDGPVLMIRSAMLGVVPSRNLIPNRYDISEHLDLMEILTFRGAVRDRFSLEYWCRRFGVQSPKVMIDGSQVDRTYRAGEIETIGDYCLRDCQATGDLYRKLQDTLLKVQR